MNKITMMLKSSKLKVTIVAFILGYACVNAQPKTVGLIFSSSCVGANYEHFIDDRSFISLDAELDLYYPIRLTTDKLGVTGSFVWNIIFAEKTSNYGSHISFYAGPGIMTGYVYDIKSSDGLVFGLKGCIGVECRFDRKITISAHLSPVIGMHMTAKNTHMRMMVYKYGLIKSFLPQIGIKYAF